MKKLLTAALAALAAFSLSAQTADIAANEKVEKVEAITSVETKGTRIYVVGDSTFSSFGDPYYYPRYGIGTKLQNYLLDKKVQVNNIAMSGRSSKSFAEEGNYWTFADNIKKGDYLIIGFGHNDEKTEEERYTNPNGSKETPGSFKHSLYTKYIKVALDKKATPVLCTPIVRRAPGKAYEGTFIHQTKGTAEFEGGDYAKAIRELAAELNIPVVDNTTYTKQLYESLGDEGTVKFHAWLGHKPGSVDNTHLNTYGASVLAYHVVNEIAKQNKNFAKLVDKKAAAPTEELLVSNPDYVIPVYSPFEPSDKSKVHKVNEPWFGTVFGDMGGAEKIENPDIYEVVQTGDNAFMLHSGGKNGKPSAGKIASGSDGLAFAFQPVSAKKDFVLKATVTVKHFEKNNQVSFGLMARDDVIIDKYDNQVHSDYVAAGALKLANGDGEWSATFQRKNEKLNESKVKAQSYPKDGDVIELSLTKTGNKYTAAFGKDSVTYEADLTEVDAKNIYVGLYTVRAAYVEFSDVSLEIK